MTLDRLIKLLRKERARIGRGDLPVYATCGSDGVSYDMGSPSLSTKDEHDTAGAVCELEDGTQYVDVYIGN